jgi:hypothetical protein
MQQAGDLRGMAGGDHSLDQLDVHATEAALPTPAVEDAYQMDHRVAVLQAGTQLSVIEWVDLNHFGDRLEMPVAMRMSCDYPALVAAVSQLCSQVSTDEARTTNQGNALDSHAKNCCSGSCLP